MARFSTSATPVASLEGFTIELFPYLVDALGASALGLLVPTSFSLGLRFGGQLVLLVALAVFVMLRLLPLTDTIWFGGTGLGGTERVVATGLATIVTVTGMIGLVTLASSAALRFQPSTQFLQLLSAVDIAWSVAAIMLAAYWLWGRRAAIAAGVLVGVVCLGSIARYLDAVGFTSAGKGRLRARALWEDVLPFDIAVAVIAIGLFFYAVRRRAHLVSG